MSFPVLQRRYELFIYWTSILYDAMLNTHSGSYIVLGHPKSGTNWMCTLLSSYFDIPTFKHWIEGRPTTQPRIFHMHRFLPFRSPDTRTVYVSRDGRDIVVSHYFEALRSPTVGAEGVRRHMSRLLGSPMSEERIREHLPSYIRFLKENRVSSVDYRTHHLLSRNRRFVRVTFEDLVRDTVDALSEVLAGLTGRAADPERVAKAVDENAFEKKKKIPEKAHFLRKGKAGDWRNYFTREAARVYDEYAGDVLIELGYERDHDWVEQVPAS